MITIAQAKINTLWKTYNCGDLFIKIVEYEQQKSSVWYKNLADHLRYLLSSQCSEKVWYI